MESIRVKNKSKVLLVYAGKTTTADIMIRLMSEYARTCSISIRSIEALTVDSTDLNWADSVLIIRGADFLLSKILSSAKKVGKRCLLYIDDDLLSLYEPGSRFYKYLMICLKSTDILWVSNKNVLEKYSKLVPKDARCVETIVLDPWNDIHDYVPEKDKIKLIFAGSPSHEPIVKKYIYPAIKKVYTNHPNIEVLFVGYSGTSLDGLDPYIRTTKWFDDAEEYRDYVVEEKPQIGLAIIEDTPFGRCKFYNKFIEYTKLGIFGIYSNCEPYTFVIHNMENGLLVENDIDSWVEAINFSIENPILRKKCIYKAQDLLSNSFSTCSIISQIRELIPELEENTNKTPKIYYNKRLMFYTYILSGYLNYLVHPAELVKKIFNRIY